MFSLLASMIYDVHFENHAKSMFIAYNSDIHKQKLVQILTFCHSAVSVCVSINATDFVESHFNVNVMKLIRDNIANFHQSQSIFNLSQSLELQ